MSPRKRLTIVMTATAVAAMLLWSALGAAPASGQKKPVLIKRINHGFYQPEPDRPIFILAIGSDAGAPRYNREGPTESGRADSIHIIGINPETRSGTIIGIPRDTLVSVPGFSGKINGAMAEGGTDTMVAAVEDLSGITIDYMIVTSFEGFEDMVNELGGVVVDVPYDVRDPRYSNADFDKGQQVLGGYQALSFARNRYSAPDGDFSRSENQGLILLGALRRARAETFEDPGILLKYLRIFFKYVQTDLTPAQALELGMLAIRIQTTDIRNVVVQGTIGTTSDGASVVRATEKARRMMRDVADDAVIDEVEYDGSSPIAGIDSSARRSKRTGSPSPSPSPAASASESPEPSPSPSATDLL